MPVTRQQQGDQELRRIDLKTRRLSKAAGVGNLILAALAVMDGYRAATLAMSNNLGFSDAFALLDCTPISPARVFQLWQVQFMNSVNSLLLYVGLLVLSVLARRHFVAVCEREDLLWDRIEDLKRGQVLSPSEREQT